MNVYCIQLILLFLIFLFFDIINADYESIYPPCTTNIYSERGDLDIQLMLYNCSNHIPTPLLPPSFYNNGTEGCYQPTNVQVQVILNSLVDVDSIDSTVTLDIYFRLYWQDPRIYMPDIWDEVNTGVYEDGIDIEGYIYNKDQLNIWLPDIQFLEAMKVVKSNELIKLLPNATLFWSRHLIITLEQANLNYNQFPLDEQTFSMSFQSYAYASYFVTLSYIEDTPVIYTKDYISSGYTISHNELWKYQYYTAGITIHSNPSATNPSRVFSIGYLNFVFKRQSQGIIFRLAVPILLYLIIVGFSLWADLDKRIDVSLQILFVTSAMYTVIGETIPFVGYLTIMDEYITVVFILLAIITGIHFMVIILDRKYKKFPLNDFFRELLILSLRLFWLPMSISLFIAYFHEENSVFLSILVGFSLICILMFINRNAHLPVTFGICMGYLLEKKSLADKNTIDEEDESLIHLTRIEIFALYLFEKYLTTKQRDYYLQYYYHKIGGNPEKPKKIVFESEEFEPPISQCSDTAFSIPTTVSKSINTPQETNEISHVSQSSETFSFTETISTQNNSELDNVVINPLIFFENPLHTEAQSNLDLNDLNFKDDVTNISNIQDNNDT